MSETLTVEAPVAEATSERRPGGLTLAALVGGVIAFAGLLIGLGPLNDNSFLTHLATGRIIFAHHAVPGHDPYSFTATGHPWVVQSWLASVLFELGEKVAGAHGVLLVVAATTTVLAGLVWTLTRPAGSMIGRLVVAGLTVGVGLGFWLERPLLFGLVALALFLLAAERRLDPRWLVPIAWVWVNVHGSFPLGLVALALLAAGARLDHRDAHAELAALKWAALGTLLGAVNPVGPHLLVFPLELLRRQDVLHNVIEWKAPGFEDLSERVFLVEIVLGILVVCRRPSWRFALPFAVFTAAALLGSRNVVIASVCFIPGLSAGMAGIGSVDGRERRSIFKPAAAVLVATAIMCVAIAFGRPTYRLDGYPVEAVTWMQAHGYVHDGAHLVAPDYVGNYLEIRYEPRQMVFLDDRYDMYPDSVVRDYIVLNRGGKGWNSVLHKYRPDIVVWNTNTPLGQLLMASSDWRVVHEEPDGSWFAAVPADGP